MPPKFIPLSPELVTQIKELESRCEILARAAQAKHEDPRSEMEIEVQVLRSILLLSLKTGGTHFPYGLLKTLELIRIRFDELANGIEPTRISHWFFKTSKSR
jgi:hypothetical protein